MESVLCAKCNEQITNGAFCEYDGNSYHPEHFICSTCGLTLSGKKFYKKPEGLICVACHDLILTPRCAECNQPIKSRVIKSSFGKNYHPEHFLCSVCWNSLEGWPFQEINGKLVCHDCIPKKRLFKKEERKSLKEDQL